MYLTFKCIQAPGPDKGHSSLRTFRGPQALSVYVFCDLTEREWDSPSNSSQIGCPIYGQK